MQQPQRTPSWAKVVVDIDLPDGQKSTHFFKSIKDLKSCVETACYYSINKPDGYQATINQQFPLAAIFFPIIDHGEPPAWMQEMIDTYVHEMQIRTKLTKRQEIQLETG